MNGVRPAEDYLRAHPEVWGWEGAQLAVLPEPKLTIATWLRAKRVVVGKRGRADRGSKEKQTTQVDRAVDYLKCHHELHHLSGRAIAAREDVPKMTYHAWNAAKKLMGIAPAPKFNGVDRTEHARKPPIKETVTFIFDSKHDELIVKSTVKDEECYPLNELQFETVDFLVWILKKKQYRMSQAGAVATYSKTVR